MRIVPACLIMVLSSTLIATDPAFGEEATGRPGEVGPKQVRRERAAGGQGDQPDNQESREGENNPGTQPTAPTLDGLKLSIEVTDTKDPDAVVFRVSIENAGDEDRVLNLGEMLANGKVLFPNAVRLTITDSDGKSRELHFSDKRFPGVAGRIDDYILPLRAGSIHTLRLSLNDFWCPETKEFRLDLKPGTYTARAGFTGTGAQFVNSDTGGLKLLNFWTGRLGSPAAPFEIGEGAQE